MPFRYRLQKILDFRIRKKEEQLMVVQKAQQAVFIAEENIRKNNEEIQATQINMRKADPMIEQIRAEAQRVLDIEKQKLVKLEQAVKVLEKHKEKNREAYLEEEKKAELKQYSELGVTRYFAQSKERQEQEEQEILRQLAELEVD